MNMTGERGPGGSAMTGGYPSLKDGCVTDVTLASAALAAVALAVLAAGPAAGPAHAVLELLARPLDAALAGLLLLGVLDPADELVARQRRDVVPGVECRGARRQLL